MTVEEVKFKRSIEKEQEKHPKTKLKSVGTALEQTEFGLKFFYIPFFLFGIIFGPTILGTIFMGLFLTCFFGSQIIGSSIKDEFKDASDEIQKPDHKAEIKAEAKTLENIKKMPNEIKKTQERIIEKQKILETLQKKKVQQAQRSAAAQTTNQQPLSTDISQE